MPERLTFSPEAAALQLERVRARTPLVHCLTNSVVTAFTANALLALGAAPAMVVAAEEVAEFAAIASALLVNIGTLDAPQARAMELAVEAAVRAGTPWVLDPVAVGFLAYRTAFARGLVTRQPAAIRGNASEILALAGEEGGGRGVDSTQASDAALDAAHRLARSTGAVVAVTGSTDFITDGERTVALLGGHPLLQRVTGTGCALSALVAAFLAGAPDRLFAVAAACACMKRAGERAAAQSAGPGSFAVAVLDALSSLEPDQLTVVAA